MAQSSATLCCNAGHFNLLPDLPLLPLLLLSLLLPFLLPPLLLLLLLILSGFPAIVLVLITFGSGFFTWIIYMTDGNMYNLSQSGLPADPACACLP